ncbi:polyhydroxyalkanoate synthesis regulator [Paenibacillus ginsengarvi]|uniref:Polyhydroxyalkanoate synthesis regulator n=1 Tax=Paenibacillus ginsengarvi TaxID=400777 RepID=A0A3B0CFD3_9BACL|nr:polyhydroxyalkanoate synthesis regulator [Paenibacillus ginsengarvi]
MNELIKKALYLGVGITVASKEKIESLVEELVKKGEVAPSESKELVAKLIEKGEEGESEMKRMMRDSMNKLLAEMNVATRQDIERLEQRLAKLETPSS